MLKYIQKLSDNDFFDLLVSVHSMRYGGSRQGFEYTDTEKVRHVHIWDNYVSFKDRDESYFTVDDYSISKPDCTVDHNVFMLYQFGEEWFKKAQRHFVKNNALDRLAMLQVAKDRYDAELAMDEEYYNEINE